MEAYAKKRRVERVDCSSPAERVRGGFKEKEAPELGLDG